MTLTDFIQHGGVSVFVILTLIQIAPIKLNPWTAIGEAVGNVLTKSVRDKMDEDKADLHRYRILRFGDEIRHHERHSEEHFNQIIDDINHYEHYCLDHPQYKNDKAVHAISKIRDAYDKCVDSDDFLV